MKIFDYNFKRPELWNRPLKCEKCGWASQSIDVYNLHDMLFRPFQCPECGGKTEPVNYVFCPNCKMDLSKNFPRNIDEIFWGGRSCRSCGVSVDKWGHTMKAESKANKKK